jgi:hypothetical protein
MRHPSLFINSNVCLFNSVTHSKLFKLLCKRLVSALISSYYQALCIFYI